MKIISTLFNLMFLLAFIRGLIWLYVKLANKKEIKKTRKESIEKTNDEWDELFKEI